MSDRPADPRLRRSLIAALSMAAVSTASYAIKPTRRLSDTLPPFDLETMVPARFGDWQALPGGQVVNPVGQALLDKLYAQVLSRVYAAPDGRRVMLSIAYGGDQSDATSMHMPEVCYPAQGFMMRSASPGTIDTASRHLPVKRLVMVHGRRTEPVTYWLVVGDQPTTSTLGHKRIQIAYAMRGLIPDGLIFRVSTIDDQVDRGFATQQAFIEALLGTLPEQARQRLAGAAA
ncbi:MAG: EpsI family protein [Burkholderiaceae bacterium]